MTLKPCTKILPIIYFQFFFFFFFLVAGNVPMHEMVNLQKTKGIRVSLLCTCTALPVIIIKSDDSKKNIRVSAKKFYFK